MKRSIAFIASLLLAALTVTGCGNDESSSESKADKKAAATEATTEETTEETTKEETTEKATEEETTEAETEADSDAEGSEADSDIDADVNMEGLEDMFTVVDAPEYAPKDSAAEADFIGKWECDCMVSDGSAYSSIFGVPLYAMFHLEIKEDGTGTLTSIDDPTNENSESVEIKWTFADGKLSAEADDETLVISINSDGRLVVSDEEEAELLYFKSVTEYTEFDFSSIEDMLG